MILWLLILNILIFNTLKERQVSSLITTSLPSDITGRVSSALGLPLPQGTFAPIFFFNVAIALSFILNYFVLAKKKHLSKKRGQSAFEFLSSYGWALAAGVLTLGALGYFGVLNLGIFVPESCILVPGLSCEDFSATYDEATGHYAVSVIIRNGFGEDLQDVSLISLVDGMTCSSEEETTTILSGQTALFSLDCVANEEGTPLGGGAIVDLGGMAVQKVNKLKAKLQITYTFKGKSIPHTIEGTFTSKPATVSTGGVESGGSSEGSNATNMTHLACVNQACVAVNGTSTNQCQTNFDCQNNVTNITHLACINLACISVNGTGINLCTTNADCQNQTNITHTECINFACVSVSGIGINQCTTYMDCQNQTNSTVPANETNLTSGSGNAQVYVTRLDYGPTAYSITLKDPDGIGQFLVRTIAGNSVYGGNPPCSYKSLTSGTVTIENSWFPLSWYNIDCIGNRQEGSIPLPSEEVPCTDSDNGKNYYTKGTTWDSYSGFDKIDYCSDSKSLVEYYCFDGYRKLILISCLDKCMGGACTRTYCAGPGLSAQVYGGGRCCEGLILQGGLCNTPST